MGGRILDLEIDGLEVATPNYDGPTMPHFPGWPGSAPYNFTDHDSKKVAGTMPTTVESVTAAVESWKTKRDRGDSYGMNPKNDWYHQMDNYEKAFIGKTVDEVEVWAARHSALSVRKFGGFAFFSFTDPESRAIKFLCFLIAR